jgi:hypothetical protein
MNTKFFYLCDGSSYNRGVPWIQHVTRGLVAGPPCGACHVAITVPAGNLEVEYDLRQKQWADAIGCGAHPLRVLSDHAIGALRASGIAVSIGGKILNAAQPRPYHWLDGARMIGVKLDHEGSGFVGVRVCGICGRRSWDIGATYDAQHSARQGIVFVKSTWEGQDIFTSDLSPTLFFCTARVLACARGNRLRNFRFIPLERANVPGPGIDYLR